GKKYRQDDRREHEAAHAESMQEAVDLASNVDIVHVVLELPLRARDLLLVSRLEQCVPVGTVEGRAGKADLTHGRTHIPKHPRRVARAGAARLPAAELADEGEETAVAQHLGERAIVEPTLMPVPIEPEPYGQDNRADHNKLPANESPLPADPL